ncbi:hypothetical protein GCM10023085_29390 [Actinomadura viridis]
MPVLDLYIGTVVSWSAHRRVSPEVRRDDPARVAGAVPPKVRESRKGPLGLEWDWIEEGT